jgi:hypothetical protein
MPMGGSAVKEPKKTMKTIILILLVAATAPAQDRNDAALPDRPALPLRNRARAAAPSRPSTASADNSTALPKGAVEVEPNLYRYTDAAGKTWLAKRTPFGFSRWEDKPAPSQPVAQVPAAQPDKATPVKVTDLGDTVRFERPTPFGKNTWVRKKTELDDEEKAWLEAARQPKATSQAKPAPASAGVQEKR